MPEKRNECYTAIHQRINVLAFTVEDRIGTQLVELYHLPAEQGVLDGRAVVEQEIVEQRLLIGIQSAGEMQHVLHPQFIRHGLCKIGLLCFKLNDLFQIDAHIITGFCRDPADGYYLHHITLARSQQIVGTGMAKGGHQITGILRCTGSTRYIITIGFPDQKNIFRVYGKMIGSIQNEIADSQRMLLDAVIKFIIQQVNIHDDGIMPSSRQRCTIIGKLLHIIHTCTVVEEGGVTDQQIITLIGRVGEVHEGDGVQLGDSLNVGTILTAHV